MPPMPETLEAESASLTRSLLSAGQMAGERILSFGVIYAAIFVFLILYVFSVRFAEYSLDEHFQALAIEAVNITELDRPIALQIQQRIHERIETSRWVTWGGVEAATLVLANDGISWIYVNGRIVPQPEGLDPTDVLREAIEMLPANVDVNVSVPHNALLANGILIAYASILLQCLYLYNRAASRRHGRQLESALSVRDQAANRAAQIESELEATRERLETLEPSERAHSEEIHSMQAERRSLQAKLAALSSREEELRGKADRAIELAEEVHALEDLLDEAGTDLESKDSEINDLESNLKRAATSLGNKQSKEGRSQARAGEQLGKRLRTLYKTLEVDDRAIHDLVGLGDENLRLKAEEKLKRLSEEADNVAVRRKVGGLPEHLSIFELGFAGKGRIYYSRGKQRHFRILAVGAKNSQDSDLEYLRRLKD
jgi:hypothetical protein